MEKFIRRDIVLNEEEIKKIENAKVAIFGLGGVGGYTFEALVRIGIKSFILCDGDVFQESNLNRQILSTNKSLGLNKAIVAKERALDINEDINITVFDSFVSKDTINKMNLEGCFIVDAIDDVENKILLIKYAYSNGNKIISMMGAGNRLFASFEKIDIYKTINDPLAKKMRGLLRKEGIKKLDVIYSKDLPIQTSTTTIGSISHTVGKAGLVLAEEVVKEILKP
ncbi:ThiF family adenylyltransferase [bacterium]|nr:ThiF family adenylyltransferase [bacterium]